MPLKIILGCTLAVTVAAPLHAAAGPFKVKGGAWEMTSTILITGNIYPADELARLAPERRAEIEKRMQEHSGKPETRVAKTCDDQLTREAMLPPQAQNCTGKTLSESPTGMEAVRTCPPPYAYTATFRIESPTPEAVSGTFDVKMKDGGKVHVDFKGKWVGPTCDRAGVEPRSPRAEWNDRNGAVRAAITILANNAMRTLVGQ